VPSSFDPKLYDDRHAWEMAVAQSEVRLQWDPDHSPSGSKLQRRAIPLGLGGSDLARYAKQWRVGIDDLLTSSRLIASTPP